MSMGREVSEVRQELQCLGLCWLCALGEAIHRVGLNHGGDGFDWKGKHRAAETAGRYEKLLAEFSAKAAEQAEEAAELDRLIGVMEREMGIR